MDLPPHFRRHSRYGDVPHQSRFYHHHLTPLPQSPPRILLPPLPPLLPPSYEGLLPLPSHISSPPYLPSRERSYFQELDPSRKHYIDRYHPPRQDNLPFRIIHDYPLRDSIIEDEIFRRGCSNTYAYDLPRAWVRELPRGAMEGSSRISEMDIREYSSSKVFGNVWKNTDADARRWDYGINESREMYFEREDDVRRWDCSSIHRGRDLCYGRNIDARRWECVASGGRELSFDRDVDRNRLDYGIRDGVTLKLENTQQELLECNLGLHRFSGRLGREDSKRGVRRLRKTNRVQKSRALRRTQLGKARRRDIRGKKILNNLVSGNLKGREKENFECLETIGKDNQDTEQSPVDLSISFKSNSLVAKAILAPSSPVSKDEIGLPTRNQKIRKTNNMADAASANSSEVLTEQIPGLSGVLCTQIGLPENFNVSGNGNVIGHKLTSSKVVTEPMPGFQSNTRFPRIEPLEKLNVSGNEKVTEYKANSLGNNVLEIEASKEMHPHGLHNFGSVRILGRRSKKKRKSRKKKILQGTWLKFADSGEIVKFETSTIITPDASKINFASDKVDIGSNTNRSSFSDQKMKYTSSNILSASLHLSGDVSSEYPAKGTGSASQLATDVVTVHAAGSCLPDENIGHGDSFGFKWHADDVELHERKSGSRLDFEKNLCDSKDLLTSNMQKVQKDKLVSEYHKSCASECENSLYKEVENVVYDKRSADKNSKEFFLEPASITEIDGYCSSKSKDAKISRAATVADNSCVGLGTATKSNFPPADHKGTLAEADISLVKTVDQLYKEGANLSNKDGCIEGTSESKIKRKRKRKRKARGTHLGTSGSNAIESFDKGRSVDNELANLLATDISSAKEANFPGAADNSEVIRLKEWPSVDDNSHLDAVDFSVDGIFPGNIKKRKVVSPKLQFSPCVIDDSIRGVASGDMKLDHLSLRLARQDADPSGETLSAMYMANTDGDNNLHKNDEMASIPSTSSVCADGSDDFATQSGDEMVAPGFDTPSCISSPEDLLSHTDFHSEGEMFFEGFQTSNLKLVSRHSRTFSLMKSTENATSGHSQTNSKVPPSLPQKTNIMASGKNKLTSAVSNNLSARPAFNFPTSGKFPSTHFANSRTWHRTDQSSINVTGPTARPRPLPQSHTPKAPRISQISYVRKGNSLVRKPSSSGGTAAHTSSSSICPTNPCLDHLRNNQVKVDTPCIQRIGQRNTSKSSQSLPLNHMERSQRSTSSHSVEPLTVSNSLGSGDLAKSSDALKETVKSFEIPECQTGLANNSDRLNALGKNKMGKKISYVKRKSNQLIAMSDPKESSTPDLDKSQASLSDGYYKKNSKNQLIRVSSESDAREVHSMATSNSHKLGSQTILPLSFGKRQSSKGFTKSYKLSKFPLVWNLNGAHLPEKSSNSLGPRKIWPHLFPWRRATYRRSSLPTFSQKLLLSSKRGAIYTRSTHGYSLRISKVLSVCGRSLKWSKSIERNSKKANEEATKAVAAAEKRKNEKKGAISVLAKSRNHVSRKSVVSVKLCPGTPLCIPGNEYFRIGSERYKMDPSGRSLHRITEEEELSPSNVLQSENNLKKSYVPRRLVIGNDEYVRIGTGNQLVRDPKKRTRVLASERVRWSLRTARLRLARKRKYCQFFTRFGKCNKSDGKCPYIHDSSKIVVCTKFLNGSCTESDCKLTHKVIPERMPDCSYFLKGSCSNENCPYRHVNVNPESSICRRFLRGYCADGNECRKKHTYVCPAFESAGICPRSSMCKLHHPKTKTEKKPISEQKIVRGRYFDGGLIDVAECSMATEEKLSAKGEDDIVCEEEKYPDYISLDVCNDGTGVL
ncbi:hypothetical protein F511_36911 [Dorcoceras hygrometricum]|uniref:C3H1-type domain-containing protein n=1 Tax=Dorcoceras hygrometricum TaxID=472368 RepID=A0A2Z7CIN4_9LAMI|nr:hypothetical protein F511_36911 [Dorcoceras hygrometricum]